MTVVHNISAAPDKKQHRAVLFIHFFLAFDSIDHDVLKLRPGSRLILANGLSALGMVVCALDRRHAASLKTPAERVKAGTHA